MRLDGEIDKEQYENKWAELQLTVECLRDKIKAHGKADDQFNDTLIGLFEIASAAGELFAKSNNDEKRRTLLRFIFASLQIKDGIIYYKLNFPFSEISNSADSNPNHSEPRKNNDLTPKTGNFEICEDNSI